MKYIRLKWNHTNPDEPVWLFSEVDAAGQEVRKIECFRNGFCDIAEASGSTSGTARLMTLPLPDLNVLAARDPEFSPLEISQAEFEEVWINRQFKAS
jgi:hypothetical protein